MSAPQAPAVVDVVIANWNGADYLGACLDALRAQALPPGDSLRAIVVDNGSADGSLALLRRYPEVRVVALPANRGFAAATNIGLRMGDGPFVALLNADAVPAPGWLAALLGVLRERPDAGSAASRIVAADDESRLDNAGHVVFADGLTVGRGRGATDGPPYDAPAEVFCASGCAALLRRAMLDDVGLLDETFVSYCEDGDLGFRARLRGWTCYYHPGARVAHRRSAATATYAPLKATLIERNRAWVAVKNLPAPLLAASLGHTLARYAWQARGALAGGGAGAGASGRFVEGGGGRLALVGILATAWGGALRGLPRALRSRRAIQGRRTVGVGEVRRWFRGWGIDARGLAGLD